MKVLMAKTTRYLFVGLQTEILAK